MRPAGIKTDALSNIYVIDMLNSSIQKFTSNGTFISKWRLNVSTTSNATRAEDMDVNSFGNIYAVDVGNSRIQEFNLN